MATLLKRQGMSPGPGTDIEHTPSATLEGKRIKLRQLALEREIFRRFDREGNAVRSLSADLPPSARSMMVE